MWWWIYPAVNGWVSGFNLVYSQVVSQVVLLKRVGLKTMGDFVKVFISYSTNEAFGLQEEMQQKGLVSLVFQLIQEITTDHNLLQQEAASSSLNVAATA